MPEYIHSAYSLNQPHTLPQTTQESAAHTPQLAVNATASTDAAPPVLGALRPARDAASAARHTPARATQSSSDKLSTASDRADGTREPTPIDLESWGQGIAWQPAPICPDIGSAHQVRTTSPADTPSAAPTATHAASAEPPCSNALATASGRCQEDRGQEAPAVKQLAQLSFTKEPTPQNLVLSAKQASDADRALDAKKKARQQQIDQSVLAFPHAGDTPLLRISDALNRDGDPAARLRQCNGTEDTPPADRPKSATDLPGSPGALSDLPKFWDADALARYLEHHPNRRMVEYTLDNLRHGADLQVVIPEGLTFEDVSHLVGTDPIPEPRQSVAENLDEARRHVQKYINAGTLVEVPPGTRVAIHPIGLVPKDTGKHRLVHDMTEKKRKTSINNMTPRGLWDIVRAVHDAPATLIKAGMTVAIVRDFKSAYRSIAVRPSQQCLQAFYLDGQCYASTSLTFGNRAAGFIWDSLASLLQWIFEDQLGAAFGVENVCVTHTGDDFFIGLRFAAHLAAAQTLVDEIILALGDRAGREKDQCGFQAVFIGLHIDLFEGKLCVKPERLTRLLEKFDRAATDVSARYTVREMLSLAGNISFVSTHSAASLVFARGLYNQANSPYAARGSSELLPTTRLDIKTMAHCLQRMSSLSVMPTKFAFVDTDASGKHGGAGALSANWLDRVPFLHFPFPSAFLTHASDELRLADTVLHGDQKASSGLLELCAVVVTIITFRGLLRGATVIVCSDSTATVAALKGMYSTLPRSAQLLKYLAALAVTHDIDLAPVHRTRGYLEHVDALTHYNEDLFRQLVPRAEERPTPVDSRIAEFLLDPLCVHETADIFQLLA